MLNCKHKNCYGKLQIWKLGQTFEWKKWANLMNDWEGEKTSIKTQVVETTFTILRFFPFIFLVFWKVNARLTHLETYAKKVASIFIGFYPLGAHSHKVLSFSKDRTKRTSLICLSNPNSYLKSFLYSKYIHYATTKKLVIHTSFYILFSIPTKTILYLPKECMQISIVTFPTKIFSK